MAGLQLPVSCGLDPSIRRCCTQRPTNQCQNHVDPHSGRVNSVNQCCRCHRKNCSCSGVLPISVIATQLECVPMKSTATYIRSSARQTTKATASGWIGSALEFYDFFIYATAASLVFPQLFFPSGNPTVAIVASLPASGGGLV